MSLVADDHVGQQLYEFFGEPPHENRIVRSPTVFQLKVSSIDPSEPAERALQRRNVGSCLRVSLRKLHQYPDPRYLLRSLSHSGKRPRGRAAEERDELAALHSITSSARASTVVGISRPSALAVLRLITNTYLVGACTGRSAGCSSLRMRST